MKRNHIIEIISSLLILLFVYTAVSKLLEYTTFKDVLSKSPIIGSKAGVFALALPIIEGIVSALLFIPRTRIWGFWSSAALMWVFTLYLAYMINFTPKLPCSCGGVLKQMNWNQHFIFNIVFLILSVTGLILERKRIKRQREEELPPVIFT